MNHHDMSVRRESPHASRLVVASHVGDEVLGCGGVLARHHGESAVMFLADPGEARLAQMRAAHRALGGVTSMFFERSAGHLSARPLVAELEVVVNALVQVIADLQPSVVYLPYPSLHHDHLVAYEAGLRATRSPRLREALPGLSVLMYDVGGVEAARYPADARWGVREPLQRQDIDRKVAGAVAYGSPLAYQLEHGAATVGGLTGLPWAEQFAVIRAPRGAEQPAPPPTAVPAGVGGVR